MKYEFFAFERGLLRKKKFFIYLIFATMSKLVWELLEQLPNEFYSAFEFLESGTLEEKTGKMSLELGADVATHCVAKKSADCLRSAFLFFGIEFEECAIDTMHKGYPEHDTRHEWACWVNMVTQEDEVEKLKVLYDHGCDFTKLMNYAHLCVLFDASDCLAFLIKQRPAALCLDEKVDDLTPLQSGRKLNSRRCLRVMTSFLATQNATIK